MNIQPADVNTIKKAAGFLRAGKLVAFPTETVYGLGGNATNDSTVAEIFSVKGRSEFNPLIIHMSDVAMAKQHVAWNDMAEELAQQFCPGPLTLVLKKLRESKISLLTSAGGNTLGIRFPKHPVAQSLLREAAIPIAAPSANRSGRVSPTTAQHVYKEFGNALPLILDGGACDVGIESTVVDVSGDNAIVLRPGLVTQVELEAALGQKISSAYASSEVLKSPGQLASHYAPTLPVRLNVTEPNSDEALLAFGNTVPKGAKRVLNLSESGDLKEAAAHLFAYLRELDTPDYAAIAVMSIPDVGIGTAINDRLRRAATR